MNRADEIYNNVLKAMQDADEIEGVENPKEYQDLMQRIENTARVRFYNSVDWERTNEPKRPSRDEMEDRLVKFEKDYLIEHEEYLYDMLRDGFKGFDNFSDEEIVKAYIDKFGED
ncbi:hypothetical protein EB001_12190 [bacterium]|nr:hypothetical protein [bacterium]